MIVPIEKPGTPEELVHHGVKGMRWGVRKAYTNRITRKAAFRQKVGLKGSAARLQAHADRLDRGEATTKDKLRMFGSLRLTDIARGTGKGTKSLVRPAT